MAESDKSNDADADADAVFSASANATALLTPDKLRGDEVGSVNGKAPSVFSNSSSSAVVRNVDKDIEDFMNSDSAGTGPDTAGSTRHNSTSTIHTIGVHEGIECDMCHQNPIVGNRYKCTIRAEYDLCEDCEGNKSQKDKKMYVATCIPPGKGSHIAKRESPEKEHIARAGGSDSPPAAGAGAGGGGGAGSVGAQENDSDIQSIGTTKSERTPLAIHEFIGCDKCGENPILGTRYHCTVRLDYDLCRKCELEKTDEERLKHPSFEMKVPAVYKDAPTPLGHFEIVNYPSLVPLPGLGVGLSEEEAKKIRQEVSTRIASICFCFYMNMLCSAHVCMCMCVAPATLQSTNTRTPIYTTHDIIATNH